MGTEIAFRKDDHFLTGNIVLLQGFADNLFGSAIRVDVGLDTKSAIGQKRWMVMPLERLRTVSQVFSPTL